MATHEVDVVVVGLGPGGEALSGQLARAGLTVAGVDRRLVGGECPYYGCIPSKMMIRAAHVVEEGRKIDTLAGRAEVHPDWGPVATRIRDEATDDWDDTVAVRRLEDAGVRFVRGHGRLDGVGRVRVGEDEYVAARGVVINPGTEPAAPPIDGLAATPYWTNREAMRASECPDSLAVIGGGAIGVELAQTFSRFGADVTVLEGADRIMAVEEPEASEVIQGVFKREGIAVRTGVRVERVEHDGRFRVIVDGDELVVDQLLVAAGRKPNLDDIGLDTVGLDPSARTIETDERMRAGDRLWAVGDVTGKGAFTHVSMYQSAVAARDLLGEDGPWADYRAVSRVTFTDPEVGSVGQTEHQAREQGLDVVTGVAPLAESSRGFIHGAGNDGVIKLVADRSRGVLVGGTTAGPTGGEVLGLVVAAVHGEIPIDRLRTMHFAYPTFHRAVETALADLG
jgi:pyruvate/2-oxoglutarate dehydrogenase complex dihydrolipoamide dehydrogenase (E3) component